MAMKQTLTFSLLVLGLALPASAADVIRPIDQRFAAADVDETPSFRRHVLPLMGRLGCNGRACHGSFQGQGGFRLSLFGYDFDADMEAIAGGQSPRIDLKKPKESLILQKPTMQVDHGGEKRMEVDSWQYRVFQKWIEDDAKGLAKDEAEFDHLEVIPREIVFRKPGETVQLKVIAHWSDGTREDVTSICRFRTNDDATATIDDNGLAKIVGKGDTHVVAFYDNGVAPVQAILPVSDLVGKKYPPVPTPTRIDDLVVTKLQKLGIVPSELCCDDEFLRRVSLDMTGTLPTPEEVKAFMADTSPDKRGKKVDELLASPAYSAWWATKLCDFTGNSDATIGENTFRNEFSQQWYYWIERRVRENKPYDEIIEGIVLATGRKPGQSFADYCQEMSSYVRKDDPADFTARETMPHYWTRRQAQPKDMALTFAYAFLGTRLQCAECHKHPFDQWTKQDFDQFTEFFRGLRYNTRNEDRDDFRQMLEGLGYSGKGGGAEQRRVAGQAREGKVVPWREVYYDVPNANRSRSGRERNSRNAGRVITPKLLGGEEVVASEYGDPREALMEWMRNRNNPYFARAFVNRVWASYFNVGIIEPPDDMNLANPPSNEALLEYLTDGFIDSGYDMKWVHRQIAGSRTYQTSWQANETNQHDLRNFSHSVIRRLPAEVAYDAIQHAVATSDAMRDMHQDPADDRWIGVKSNFTRQATRGDYYAMALFGKPTRTSNCDCERSVEPSLLQTIYLRNDGDVYSSIDNGWLRELSRSNEKEKQTDAPGADARQTMAAIGKLEQRIKRLKQNDQEKEAKAAEKQLSALKKKARQIEQARLQKQAEKEQPSKPSPALDHKQLVEEAYLRTLGRFPNERELQRASAHLADSGDTLSGMRDLLWALLNTKEFIVNR
jgi:hypothetical protein